MTILTARLRMASWSDPWACERLQRARQALKIPRRARRAIEISQLHDYPETVERYQRKLAVLLKATDPA